MRRAWRRIENASSLFFKKEGTECELFPNEKCQAKEVGKEPEEFNSKETCVAISLTCSLVDIAINVRSRHVAQ